jgi:hypothetical protein
MKVKLFLHLNNQALSPEDVWGSEVIAPPLLSSALIIVNRNCAGTFLINL